MGSVEGKYVVPEDDANSLDSLDFPDTIETTVEPIVVDMEGCFPVVEEDESGLLEAEKGVEPGAELEGSTVGIVNDLVNSLVEEAQADEKKSKRKRAPRGKKNPLIGPVEATPTVESIKPMPVAKPEPKPILKKADLHELVKREQILIHRLGTVGEADRSCFACGAVCKSRHQLNHHYGICAAFPRAYEKMDPNERSWYMMIQYVRDDLAKASCLCMGCGSVFKTRHDLFRHNIRCEKAMTIDMWDRVMCFGLLYDTPYDDFAKFAKKYKEPKKCPDYVSRVHTFVEDLKKAVLKEKAAGRLAEERMKLQETEQVEKYVEERLAAVKKPTPTSEPEPSIPSEYIENCTCEHCDRVKTYVPLQNPALKGVEREGYFVIPMVMDGYSTVLNNRRIYIPTQNVLLRIHDLGPA